MFNTLDFREEEQSSLLDLDNESFIARKEERDRKYELSKEPFKRFRLITEELMKSPTPSKSDSEWGTCYC